VLSCNTMTSLVSMLGWFLLIAACILPWLLAGWQLLAPRNWMTVYCSCLDWFCTWNAGT
jgi:hypothetical protein